MNLKKIGLLTIFTFALSFLFTICGCSKNNKKSTSPSVALFVPGIMADSPIYANLAKGVSGAIDEWNLGKADDEKALLYVMEAGTNQAEWSAKLTSLAASGKYDLIISSNPSLPEYAQPLTKEFPEEKFIFLDAECYDNENIACLSYSQKEEAYLSGYIAGLISKSHKVALLAAQEYPVMNNILKPYYEKGASDAYEGTTCDFRVLGNWYDAAKAAEITDALARKGVDVILPICGGASQGVISSAVENGIYLNWFDENGFSKAPSTIISSCMVEQEKAAKEVTLEYLNGKTEWGKTKTLGFKEGYITFIDDDPLYLSCVEENVRNEIQNLISSIKEGKVLIDLD